MNVWVGGGEGRSEAGIKDKSLVSSVYPYSRYWIFPDAFFEEFCFPLKADCFYPLKRVANF